MLALALRWTSACLILLSFAAPLRAQTIDDGIMLKRHVVFAETSTPTTRGMNTGKGRSSATTGTSAC